MNSSLNSTPKLNQLFFFFFFYTKFQVTYPSSCILLLTFLCSVLPCFTSCLVKSRLFVLAQVLSLFKSVNAFPVNSVCIKIAALSILENINKK